MEKLKELFAFLFPAFFTKINNKQKNFKNPLTNPENYDTIIERMHHGPLVKRLRHGPLKAETGVRFSHGSPQNEAPQARCFFRSVATRDRTSSLRRRRLSEAPPRGGAPAGVCPEGERGDLVIYQGSPPHLLSQELPLKGEPRARRPRRSVFIMRVPGRSRAVFVCLPPRGRGTACGGRSLRMIAQR